MAVSARHGSATDNATVKVDPVGDEELVGVLPSLARRSPPPTTEPLSVPIGTARFVTVDLPTLGVIGSLGPLGTLATDNTQLNALDPVQRTNLLSWLAAGGRLLVDERNGPVTGLPGGWQPTAARPRATAALGEVRLTGGAPWPAAGGAAPSNRHRRSARPIPTW